jgi:CTD small phosphatase-like protein 2
VINLLDPTKKLVKYRLYREACLRVENTFIKDLNVLGRDINKTIIVDNALHSFAYQELRFFFFLPSSPVFFEKNLK